MNTRKALHRVPAALAALGLAVAAPFQTAHAQNLVQNGGFETGALAPWTTDSALDGVLSGPDYAHTGTYGFAYGSVGLPLSHLTQTLATTAGGQYTITFFQHQLGSTPNELIVAFGGTTLFDGVNLPLSGYRQYSFTGTAPATATDLTFGLRQDAGFSALDDISVTANGTVAATPEPSSVAAFAFTGFGVFCLMLKACRRRFA